MDPYICCLLDLCCNASEKHDKLVALVMERDPRVAFDEAEARVKHDLELVRNIRHAMRQVLGL